MPWRRDHADALGDLSVTIQQLEPRPGKVEPLGGHGFLLARAVQLRALDVERRVLEDRVLAAVVEMEVAVDHDLDVGWAQVVLGQCIGGVAIHHLPFLQQLRRKTHPGVDEDRTGPGMLDHEAVHGDLVEGVEAREVKANDLHADYGRNGEAANRRNRSARYTTE